MMIFQKSTHYSGKGIYMLFEMPSARIKHFCIAFFVTNCPGGGVLEDPSIKRLWWDEVNIPLGVTKGSQLLGS